MKVRVRIPGREELFAYGTAAIMHALLVVALFGGTFVENAKKCHAPAFEKATGATVKFLLGNSVQTAG